ncbi:MAG: hypothetical protein V7629_00365 [Motiliproteus sp.]
MNIDEMSDEEKATNAKKRSRRLDLPGDLLISGSMGWTLLPQKEPSTAAAKKKAPASEVMTLWA